MRKIIKGNKNKLWDISILSNLVNLKQLNLDDLIIENVDSIKLLINLEQLKLSYLNDISDFSLHYLI